MVDYCNLGDTEKTKTRRFRIIGLLAKGATPPEIGRSLKKAGIGVSMKTVYRDVKAINQLYAQGDNTPLAVIQAQGATFYAQKIRELEGKAAQLEKEGLDKFNLNVWMGIQKLLIQLKDSDLKLKGAFIERVEHSGSLTVEEKLDEISEFVLKYVKPEDRKRMAELLRKKKKEAQS